MEVNRRKFISRSALLALTASIKADIVFGNFIPKGLKLLGLDASASDNLKGKSKDLLILNDRPINAETPAHLLNDELTPNELFFVRNNGLPPQAPNIKNWSLEVSGESVKRKMTFSIDELKSKFETVSYNLTLECGGNGRKEFNPPAKGNQWSTGAVGCAKWTGVRVKDVLNYIGLKSNAVYLAYYGADTHLSGDPNKEPISRGVPIHKAMEDESLIAWSMNDQDIPLLNGYPLRLVFGGYPASCSGKWLTQIVIRNKVHDGQKMLGSSYRIPCDPVAPGAKVKDEDMCIIEEMPVKSLITYPKSGASIKLNQELPISGQAWTSANEVQKVEYSIDFGQTWNTCNCPCSLCHLLCNKSNNKFAWQRFNAKISFPRKGYYEV